MPVTPQPMSFARVVPAAESAFSPCFGLPGSPIVSVRGARSSTPVDNGGKRARGAAGRTGPGTAGAASSGRGGHDDDDPDDLITSDALGLRGLPQGLHDEYTWGVFTPTCAGIGVVLGTVFAVAAERDQDDWTVDLWLMRRDWNGPNPGLGLAAIAAYSWAGISGTAPRSSAPRSRPTACATPAASGPPARQRPAPGCPSDPPA